MAVSRRLRYEVLRRDNHSCRYCGGAAPDVKLTIDHVVPVALGGSDDPTNLVAACADCNGGKSASTPDAALVDDVSADAVRWARARHEALVRWRDDRDQTDSDVSDFGDLWEGYTAAGRQLPRADDWETTVLLWFREGLNLDDLEKLLASTMTREKYRNGHRIAVDERWRYFCGAVWRTLEDINERTDKAARTPTVAAPSPVDVEEGFGPEDHYDIGHERGYLDALDWAIKEAAEALGGPRGDRPCRGCGDLHEYEATGMCLGCWRDSLSPRDRECRRCKAAGPREDGPCWSCGVEMRLSVPQGVT
jgi:hypothetical protein